MSGWSAGDLALCVRDDWERDDGGPFRPGQAHPRAGGVYRVEEVLPACNDCGASYLVLDQFDPAYNQISFRRIAPLTDEETRQAREDFRVGEVVE